MKHFRLALGLTAVLTSSLLVPAGVRAQEREALARYELEKKNEIAAAGIEWLIPILGHHYAGDATAGYVPAAVSAGGLVAMLFSRQTTTWFLGLLAYSGGRVWGIVSALDVAREFNRDLADRLGVGLDDVELVVSPSPGGVSVGFTLPLGGRR